MRPNAISPIALLGLCALCALIAVAIGPAGAVTREGFTVAKGAPANKTYPAMTTSSPVARTSAGASANVITVSNCKTVTFCDDVPFEVVVPAGTTESDEFGVTIELSWDDPTGTNDVDMYAWDDGQIKGGANTQVGGAATRANPERMRLSRPTLGAYHLLPHNVQGANTGYKVKATLTIGKFESSVEQLAPERKSSASTTTTTTRPQESLEPDATTTTLAPVAVDHDDDFDFGASDFDRRIALTPEQLAEIAAAQREIAAPAPSKPKKASPAALIASFVITPLALVGGSGTLIWRRRKSLAL